MENNEDFGGVDGFQDMYPDWSTSGDVMKTWEEYSEKVFGQCQSWPYPLNM